MSISSFVKGFSSAVEKIAAAAKWEPGAANAVSGTPSKEHATAAMSSDPKVRTMIGMDQKLDDPYLEALTYDDKSSLAFREDWARKTLGLPSRKADPFLAGRFDSLGELEDAAVAHQNELNTLNALKATLSPRGLMKTYGNKQTWKDIVTDYLPSAATHAYSGALKGVVSFPQYLAELGSGAVGGLYGVIDQKMNSDYYARDAWNREASSRGVYTPDMRDMSENELRDAVLGSIENPIERRLTEREMRVAAHPSVTQAFKESARRSANAAKNWTDQVFEPLRMTLDDGTKAVDNWALKEHADSRPVIDQVNNVTETISEITPAFAGMGAGINAVKKVPGLLRNGASKARSLAQPGTWSRPARWVSSQGMRDAALSYPKDLGLVLGYDLVGDRVEDSVYDWDSRYSED